MKTEQSYCDFLFLLTEDQTLSQKIASELMDSEINPESFFQKHKEAFFSQRGVEKSGNPKQTLLYMIDVLIEHSYMCELDWKPDAEELNFAIQEMSRGKIEDLVNEEEEEDADGMFELLDIAEELLEEKGFGILHLDIDSDSHPIALVKLDKVEKLDEMAAELFYAD